MCRMWPLWEMALGAGVIQRQHPPNRHHHHRVHPHYHQNIVIITIFMKFMITNIITMSSLKQYRGHDNDIVVHHHHINITIFVMASDQHLRKIEKFSFRLIYSNGLPLQGYKQSAETF